MLYDDCCRHPEVTDPHYRDESDNEDDDALSVASSASEDTADDDEEDVASKKAAAAPRTKSSPAHSDGANDEEKEHDPRAGEDDDDGAAGAKRDAHPLPGRSSGRKRRKVVHYSPVKERNLRGGYLHRKHTEEEAAQVKKKTEAKKVKAAAKAAKKPVKEKNKGDVKRGKAGKTEGEGEATAAGMGGVMELLRQMLEKQNELIAEMHHKAVEDAKDPNNVTAKKVKMAPAANDGETFVHVEPKWAWNPEGENDMERLMRSSLQVARLIDENAELRRDKLVRDMVVRSNKQLNKLA